MRQITITQGEEGQSLLRILTRYLKEAPSGFLYKMLRKKNITLNGKKATGKEKVREGDEICLYLSEDTLLKFTVQEEDAGLYPRHPLDILYEDSHVLIVNKPPGMLTQKAKDSDLSLNEYVIGYLLDKKEITAQSLKITRPSVCNRLDRNTGGIVICGKTATGLREMSRFLRERSLTKEYLCIAAGQMTERRYLKGYLEKDPAANRVRVSTEPEPGFLPVETESIPLACRGGVTLAQVRLITGRSHQIRAHLSFVGFPIVGDPKYGDPAVNDKYRREYGVTGQLLHAYRLSFPKLDNPALTGLSEKTLTACPPEFFSQILRDAGIDLEQAGAGKGE